MKIIKWIFITALTLPAVPIALVTINILQNGIGGWDGRTVEEILNKSAETATEEDIEKLSKSEVMQLFYAAEAPAFENVKGEYKAKLVPGGVLYRFNEYYAHNLMGPGRWEAKCFSPNKNNRGEGYNLFTVTRNGITKGIRTLRMDTFMGQSKFDDKESFHLVYAAHNKGRNHAMRDEIRRISDRLYVGLGYLTWTLGTLNPSPFVLYGEPKRWVGPDQFVAGSG